MASRSASSGASGRSAPSGGWRACRATPRCVASGEMEIAVAVASWLLVGLESMQGHAALRGQRCV